MSFSLKETTKTNVVVNEVTKEETLEQVPLEDNEKVIVKTESITEELKVETIENEINIRRLKMIDAFEAYNNYVIANNGMYIEVDIKISHPIFDLITAESKTEYKDDAKI